MAFRSKILNLLDKKENVPRLLVLASLILWLSATLQLYPLRVTSEDFLGLTSRLPVIFWLGLALLFLAASLTILRKVRISQLGQFGIAMVLALYLFATPILASPNPQYPWSYYPSAETISIINQGRVNTEANVSLTSYLYLPGFHFISAALVSVTGVSLESLLHYFPIAIVFLLLASILFVANCLNLTADRAFLLMLLFLSSFWVPWYYYCPFAFALVLLFLVFGLAMRYRYSYKKTLVILILTLGIILTHTLTSIVLLLSLIAVCILKRQVRMVRPILLMVISMVLYYVVFATRALVTGASMIGEDLANVSNLFSFYGSKFSGGSLQQQAVSNSRISMAAIISVFFLVSFLLIIKRKTESRTLGTTIVAWLLSPLLLVFLRYGHELFEREFTFLLVPALALIVLVIKNEKYLLFFLLLCLVVNIPAHYGSESFDLVYTTDLNGSHFISLNVPKNAPVLYAHWQYLDFYDQGSGRLLRVISPWESPDQTQRISAAFIVDSQQSGNMYRYYFGFDPLQGYANVVGNSLVFNNGEFQLLWNATFK